jgi:hypothetical protein
MPPGGGKRAREQSLKGCRTKPHRRLPGTNNHFRAFYDTVQKSMRAERHRLIDDAFETFPGLSRSCLATSPVRRFAAIAEQWTPRKPVLRAAYGFRDTSLLAALISYGGSTASAARVMKYRILDGSAWSTSTPAPHRTAPEGHRWRRLLALEAHGETIRQCHFAPHRENRTEWSARPSGALGP